MRHMTARRNETDPATIDSIVTSLVAAFDRQARPIDIGRAWIDGGGWTLINIGSVEDNPVRYLENAYAHFLSIGPSARSEWAAWSRKFAIDPYSNPPYSTSAAVPSSASATPATDSSQGVVIAAVIGGAVALALIIFLIARRRRKGR